VEAQEQSEQETCQLIVFGRGGTEVLLKFAEAGFAFPCVKIPRWERRAEKLTAALKRDWGCEAVCLFTVKDPIQDDDLGGDHYEVMESWHEERHSRETVWEPIGSLAAESFPSQTDFLAFERCTLQLHGYESDPLSPFARRGWLNSFRDWTANVIQPLGLELTRPLRQYNAGPAFNLIRCGTTGPAVWFKAVGAPNLREFPITLKLTEQFPKYLPEMLGTRGDWNGWLSREAEGVNLADAKDIAEWEKAASELARLQIESVAKTESILDAGAHDLRTETLSRLVQPFLTAIAQLMAQQTKTTPPALSCAELKLLGVRIQDSLTLLGELTIPDALGHLDLNPGNIIVSADGCVFVDWAEAHVGSPWLSFEYLLEHFRHRFGTDVAFETRLAGSFSTPWRELLSGETVAEALALAPLVAVFAYAAGNDAWKDQDRLKDAKVAGYFRGLARRMNREAVQFRDGSSHV
jgi:hypothetical protein